MRIASWNINSVRLRINLVARFIEEMQPDVLCLQETKCPDDKFPAKACRSAGMDHIATFGQKGYHGVAILSRFPLENIERRDFCAMGDARHVAADVTAPSLKVPVRIHNFYIPAGGDVPDPSENPKFAHKLAFLDELKAWFATGEDVAAAGGAIMLGDLNVAPLPDDVWSHKQLLKVVSHTPIETERLDAVRDAFEWVDLVRQHTPAPERVYSWWSYRARDWEASNKGRRLDHIWATSHLAPRCTSAHVVKPVRGWTQPSDHAPVVADLA